MAAGPVAVGPGGPRGCGMGPAPWGPHIWFLYNILLVYFYLAAFWGQVLSFLRFCVFFRVFRSRSLQNRPGTCLNASGMCFASKLHMEMGKIIGKSIRSEHFGISQFWEFSFQPFGENTFSGNVPKDMLGSLWGKGCPKIHFCPTRVHIGVPDT